MFPINFNFPYRKKDGSLITMEKALDGAGADLDLIDLDDVAIIDPAEGDGLIYDNTAHKWKNIPIISRILTLFNAWKKNGAYNILPNTGTTNTVQGLAFTKNSDDTVTVGTGTAEGDIYFAVDVVGTLSEILEVGEKYKLVGCPSGGGTDYYLYNGTSGDGVKDNGTGCVFTWSNSYNTGMFIYIKSGTVISEPLIFKPMITADLNATYDDYVPYAMTNRELTEKKQYNVTTSINSSNATVQIAFIAIRKGTMVNLYGYVQANTSIDAGSNISGTFSGMPKPLWPCTSATFSATMTFCANLGIDGAFTVRVPANISSGQSIFLNFTYATEDLI